MLGLNNLILLLVYGLWLVEIIMLIFVCIDWVSIVIVGVGIGLIMMMFMLMLVKFVIKVDLSI